MALNHMNLMPRARSCSKVCPPLRISFPQEGRQTGQLVCLTRIPHLHRHPEPFLTVRNPVIMLLLHVNKRDE
jgi:hypothetical protein